MCRACNLDWPCETARAALREEYRLDPLALFVYLGIMVQDATRDLYTLNPNPGPDPAELYERFIAWVPVTRMIRRALLIREFQEGILGSPPSNRPATNSGP
jgi:hypothetical protein